MEKLLKSLGIKALRQMQLPLLFLSVCCYSAWAIDTTPDPTLNPTPAPSSAISEDLLAPQIKLAADALTLKSSAAAAGLITAALARSDQLLQQGQGQEAVAVLEQARAQAPHSWRLQRALALAWHQVGELNKAREQYRRWLEQDPDDPLALCGWLLLSDEPLDSQLLHVEALNRRVSSPFVQAFLASLYLRAQRFVEAELWLRQAVAVASAEPAWWFNLALSLDQQGRGLEALEHYRQAQSRGFSSEALTSRMAALSAPSAQPQSPPADPLKVHER